MQERRKTPGLNYDAPYIPFPPNPEVVKIAGSDAYLYISPEEIDGIIGNLSKEINLNEFEAVIVNLNGGKFLYERLKDKQDYKGSFIPVEYHRPDNGIGVNITTAVPDNLAGKRCLVIDDISDRGDTFMAILEKLSPDSVSVALVSKKDIEGKKEVPNLLIGVVIDGKVWIAGCGMDIGNHGEGDEFRNYPGILAKIPKEITPDDKWIY